MSKILTGIDPNNYAVQNMVAGEGGGSSEELIEVEAVLDEILGNNPPTPPSIDIQVGHTYRFIPKTNITSKPETSIELLSNYKIVGNTLYVDPDMGETIEMEMQIGTGSTDGNIVNKARIFCNILAFDLVWMFDDEFEDPAIMDAWEGAGWYNTMEVFKQTAWTIELEITSLPSGNLTPEAITILTHYWDVEEITE